MEVHHHPELHSKNKKFKEYFLEFLMIFLAVTMGFIAENIRETITKHEREEKLMVMMIEDLKSDHAKIDSTIVKNNIKIIKLDTLRSLVYASANKELPDSIIKIMYYLYRLYAGNIISFTPTQRTLSQFEKNDAFSLLRNQEVSDSLLGYSDFDMRLQNQSDAFHEFQLSATEIGETIFNSEFLENFKSRDSAEVFLRTPQNFQLMAKDKQILRLYGNKLFSARSVLLNYIIQLNQQKVRGEKLSALIKNKYHLETD